MAKSPHHYLEHKKSTIPTKKPIEECLFASHASVFFLFTVVSECNQNWSLREVGESGVFKMVVSCMCSRVCGGAQAKASSDGNKNYREHIV